MNNKLFIAILVAGFAITPVVFAQTTSTLDTTKKQCITSAVTARENSLITAHDTLNTSIKSAITARSTGLIAALEKPTRSERVAARNSARSTFRTSSIVAHKTLRDARNSTYSTYNSAIKACGVQSEIGTEKPTDIGSANTATSL
jgi:hypothetical protein